MVTVNYEIGITQLVHDDGREGVVGKRLGDTTHPLANMAPAGRESPVEVPGPSFCPNDVVHRDRAHPNVVT
jgi:hypothetical protein